MSVVVAEGVVEVTADASNVSRDVAKSLDSNAPIIDGAGGRGGKAFLGGFLGAVGGQLLTSALSGIANAAGQAIGNGIRYGIDSVGLAGDLSETGTAVEALFGPAAQSLIGEWSTSAATSLGQSQQQALDAAKTFGVFGTSAGLAGGDLATFATDLTGLATDLASFHNTSPEEAVLAIGAALRGEMEPIRSYGILLDDASLKQQAMAMGIYDGVGSLTAQQKVLATNALLYEQAGAAVGDFDKTSGGLANQQRILEASLTNTQTKLGTALLPTITQLATFANESLVPILNDTIEKIGPQLGEALTESTPSIMALVTEAVKLLPPLIELGVAILPPLVEVIKVITPLIVDWTTNTAAFWQTISGLFGFLSGDKSLEDLREQAGETGGSMFEMASTVGTAVGTVIGSLIAFAGSARENVTNFLNAVGEVPGRVQAIFSGAWDWLSGVGSSIIGGLVNGFRSMFGTVRSTLQELTSSIFEWKGPEARDRTLLVEPGQWIMGGLEDGLRSRFGAVRSLLGSFTDTLGAPTLVQSSAANGITPSTGTTVIQVGDVRIDASSIKSIADLIAIFESLPQVARAGGATV